MTRSPLLRISILGFVALLTIALVRLLPDASPARNGAATGYASFAAANRAALESPDQLMAFYLQRLFGSPGTVNIQERTWQAYTDMMNSPQSALRKPFAEEFTWKLEGPTNISGRVRSVAFHPTEPNTLYVGAASGGVWKSTDLGGSWIPLTDHMPAMAVGAVAISPSNPDVILAGTGEPAATSYGRKNGSPFYSGLGVLRSDDGGASWELLPWPRTSSGISRIAIHPESADTFLVAEIDRMYKTVDGGQTFQVVMTGYISDVAYRPGDPSTVYATVGDMSGSWRNGVYVSHAGGENGSWVKLENNFPPADSTGRMQLAICEQQPDIMYVAVAKTWKNLPDRDADFKVVMKTEDGGESWERKNGAISPKFTRSQAWYDLCIAVAPDNPNLVVLGGIDQHVSTDGGTSFQQKSDWRLRTMDPNNPSYVHADQHAIAFMPGNSSTIMVGSDGGTYLSKDAGNSWEDRTSGLSTVQFYGIAYAPSNPRLLYGGTQDNSNMRQSSPNEGNWYFVEGGDGGNIAVDPLSSDLLYMCINSTPLRVFGSGSIVALTDGLSGTFNWIRPMVLSPGDGNRLFTASNYVFRLTPASQATSWYRMSDALVRGSGGNAIVTDLAVPETAPLMMYTVSGDGKAYVAWNTISLDVEFEDISKGLPIRWFSDVTPDWSDYRTVYVAASGYGSGHAFKTTNAGEEWTDITGDLPDVPANAIIPSRVDANTIYLANDLGVWYTTNGGSNWKQFGNGLPNAVAYDMRLTPDNRLIVGTFGRGMWSVDVVLDAGDAPPAPEGITLSAFPNPFGPAGTTEAATINFSVRSGGKATLGVFDASGRRVATLLDEDLPAGAHSRRLASGSLPAGVYFVTLEAMGQRMTSRLLLLR